MSLIHAAIGSVTGTLADQYKEYFYCDALPANVLAVKGVKRKSGRSGNYGSDNVISDGSVISIADGQCMLIVDQGQVIDICAEPGEYIYDVSSEPSVFTGSLGDGVAELFNSIYKRFTFGGQAPTDQRVYYFNTKEITSNKYGTPNAVPFRVVDKNAGIDIDIGLRCFGEYSYKITNPILFYQNVCGNFSSVYTTAEIESQMKTELLTALQPAFSKISGSGIRYSEITAHTMELADALNEVLSAKWKGLRGIEIVSFGVTSLTANEEDEKMIKDMQRNAAYKDPTLAAANLAGAQAQAMKDAANNAGGAANGFIGMNMAQNAGGVNVNNLYTAAANAQAGSRWFCPNCGTECHGNFCTNCGTGKPE